MVIDHMMIHCKLPSQLDCLIPFPKPLDCGTKHHLPCWHLRLEGGTNWTEEYKALKVHQLERVSKLWNIKQCPARDKRWQILIKMLLLSEIYSVGRWVPCSQCEDDWGRVFRRLFKLWNLQRGTDVNQFWLKTLSEIYSDTSGEVVPKSVWGGLRKSLLFVQTSVLLALVSKHQNSNQCPARVKNYPILIKMLLFTKISSVGWLALSVWGRLRKSL